MAATASDSIIWTPHVEVRKYDPSTVLELTDFLGHEPTGNDLTRLEDSGAISPDSYAYADGNALVTTGLQRLALLITGSGAAFTATQGFAGVGDSTTAVAAADTGLSAATNRLYKLIDAAPTANAVAGQIAANATFQSADANYAWNEWCWGIATGTLTQGTSLPGTSPIILNRKVQSLGTKAPGAVWTLQATVLFS